MQFVRISQNVDHFTNSQGPLTLKKGCGSTGNGEWGYAGKSQLHFNREHVQWHKNSEWMNEKCLLSIGVYLYLSVCQFYMTRFIVLCTLGNYLYTCQYTYEDIYVRTIKDKEYHTCMCLTYMYHTCLADKTSQYCPFSLQQSFRLVIST